MQFTDASWQEAAPLSRAITITDTAKPTPALRGCWRCLDILPGLAAVPSVWQEAWREQFTAFKTLCLQPKLLLATTVSCANCGCLHAVILRHDHTGAIGICRCQPPVCPDVTLTIEDITFLEVELARLGRGLRVAFGFEDKTADVPLPHTIQFGIRPADDCPAILTIQTDQLVFRRVAVELASRLARPFMLFAPSSAHMERELQAELEEHGTSFFTLEASVALRPDGTLEALHKPGEMGYPSQEP